MQHKLIMENWRRYEQHHTLLEDEEYIAEVLGIDMLMQETVHSPTKVQELVVEEYAKMQDWWAPLDRLDEEGGFWSRVKETGKGTWKLLKLMKSLMTGGAASLKTYMKAIMRKGIGNLKEQLFYFLDIIIEKKESWNIPSIAAMAEKIKGWVESAYKKLDGMKGWMKAIAATSVALGIRYVMSQIQDLIDETIKFYKGGSEEVEEGLIAMITEKVKGFVVKVVKEIAKGVGAAWGDVTAWWDWAKKVFGGLEFVTSALSGTLQFASSRGIANRDESYA